MVQNLYLKFQTDASRDPQIIQLSSNDPVAIANQINTQLSGILVSVLGISPNRTLAFRSSGSYLKIFETQASDALGISAGNYVPQQLFTKIASAIPWVLGTQSYSYTDADGAPTDFYSFTTVDPSSVESILNVAFQAPNNQMPLCSVNGLLLDPQGQPVANMLVYAKNFLSNMGPETCPPSQPPTTNPAVVNPVEDSVMAEKILAQTYTDDLGRLQMSLPQFTRVFLSIEEGNFSRIFLVPPQPFLSVGNIASDMDWRFNNDAIINIARDF